jgi:hypothetical protein
MDKDKRHSSRAFRWAHCRAMRSASAAFALLTLLAWTGNAAPADDVTTLVLPHPLRAGETAWIEVQVGPISRGQEIDVATTSGQELGVISPFGVRAGQDAGTYTLPVPGDAIHDGRVSVRLTITQFGRPPRAPTAQEVRSVKLTVAAASR